MKKPAAKGQTAKHAPAKTKHAPAAKTKHTAAAKHHPSKAQAAAQKAWQSAGSKASATARHKAAVARHAQHAKPVTWSPGWDVSCCGAEALAVSLRLTGAAVADEDVLALYWRTTSDPGAGATLWDTLQAAAEHGLAGVRPVAARPAEHLADGVLVAVELAEPHAVVLDGGVWSWGEWWPVTRPLAVLEAWEVTWP